MLESIIKDFFQDVIQSILRDCIYDSKALRDRNLNKQKEHMATSEKVACSIVVYASAIGYLLLMLIIPLFSGRQGFALFELLGWGLMLQFILVELLILLARALKKSPQHRLRQLIFIRYRIRPLWMHVTR